MERNAEDVESPLVPPRRRKGSIVDKIGRLYLAQDSHRVLIKLSKLYGLSELYMAELILQSVLNLVPIIEMTDIDKLTPEQVVDILADTISVDNKVYKTREDLEKRKQNKEKMG